MIIIWSSSSEAGQNSTPSHLRSLTHPAAPQKQSAHGRSKKQGPHCYATIFDFLQRNKPCVAEVRFMTLHRLAP